MEITRTYR